MTLAVGDKAPDFTLLNQDEDEVTLKDLKGKWVVLYFYPKAMTPGCTVQAQGIRDSKRRLSANGIVTLGVSPDAPARLKKFEDKEELNFDLLADEDIALAKAYGVWQKKKTFGKEYMGIVRTTFIIDPKGKIAEVMAKVKTKTHHDDVIEAVKALKKG